jgi:orotate phosphoribosyltransferase
MDFLDKFLQTSSNKNSILCVGLDPTIEKLNKLGYKIKDPIEDAAEAFVSFCIDRIEQTWHHTCSYKPNRQFLIPLSIKQMHRITTEIHHAECISIIDHKLSDIGKTNKEGLFWIKQEGFDAVTCSPFAGNIEETVKMAHELGLGAIMLCLMSNPEAALFMKAKLLIEIEGRMREVYGYEEIARRAARAKADGIVVGATGHVSIEDLAAINRCVGPDMFRLYPGVGTQGGDEQKTIMYGGRNQNINVGSALIFQEKLGEEASKWNYRFNEIREAIVPTTGESLATEIEETVAALYWEAQGVLVDTKNCFTLASGNKSPIYMDSRKVNSNPVARRIILSLANVWVEEVLSKYPRNQVVIAGGETAGAVWAQSLAESLGLRYVFFRKKPKSYGTEKRVEGDLHPGDIILWFEDLITDGGSGVSFIEAAQKTGAIIYKVIFIVDREQGGRQRLAGLSLPVEISRMTTSEKILSKGIKKKRINLAQLKEVEEYMLDSKAWNIARGFGWKEQEQ